MKYSGKIGVVKEQEEVSPGVFRDVVKEYPVRGDVLQLGYNQNESQNSTNDTIRITNRLSILVSPTLLTGMGDIRWATMHTHKWKVTSVNIRGNRLELSLGGLYDDKE